MYTAFPRILKVVHCLLLTIAIPVAALAQTPTVAGVINAQGGTDLSPGMKVWIAGTNFGRTIKATTATVQVAGRPAGILEAWPWFGGNSIVGDLLVVQLPVNIDPGAASLVVTVEGRSSVPFNLALDQYAPVPLIYRGGPAFFGNSPSKGGFQKVQPDGSLAFLSCLPGETVKPGDTLAIYALGLGATDPVVPNLTPAPSVPPARTLVKPSVQAGGQRAEVQESLLVPGEIGAYLVTFKLPDIGEGPRDLTLSIGAKAATWNPIRVGRSLSHYLENMDGDIGAPESLIEASSCGGSLAPTLYKASDPRNPPDTLAGATARIKDSAGVDRAARILSVGQGNLEYVIPAGTANGNAEVAVTTSDGSVFLGRLDIQTVVPRIFAHPSATGYADSGPAPAGVVVRLRDGMQTVEPIGIQNDDCWFGCVVPIDLGPETDQVFLELFGTAMRNRSSLANVSVKIGGVDVPVEYAGPQGELAGVDQVNVRLPRSLAGRGSVPVEVTVDGKIARTNQTYFVQFN